MDKLLCYIVLCAILVASSKAARTTEIEALLEVLGPNPKEPFMQNEMFLVNWLESYKNDLLDAVTKLQSVSTLYY